MEFDQPTGGPLKVLNGVSMAISHGDTVALMGQNGCGKTTLLRIIAGELAPTSGKVYLGGKDASSMPAYKRARFIGRVHQESYKSLASDLTVEETLALAARRNDHLLFGFPKTQDVVETVCRFSERAADFVGPRMRLVSRTLSGGQRQLLAIITSILGQPRVLLLDEHLASLDSQYRNVAAEMLASHVRQQQGAALAVTHDLDWVADVRAISLRFADGTLIAGYVDSTNEGNA
ncbi:MAG TPA: ATP-binding cassette domain-containing protein [Kiritimatiellia bacterium]|nr:ATP-binding cassette domain-containing protein [Kiritimatiellia bacterium]HMP33358.1 ATP-binding cassette domain-containing protein [Kiritimatiellia bacterium]